LFLTSWLSLFFSQVLDKDSPGYRIQKTKEILDLGFKKIISDQKNIVTIEWADRIRGIMPKDTIWIHFDFIDEKRRKIRSMVK